ncbi:MAG: protease modulator HflC [Bauldia sp.]|nr:protease modulator HflC [Bauldia sp.]
MRRGIFGVAGLIVLVAIAILLYLSIYVVDPTRQALVLRFGQVVATSEEPGLYFRVPFIDNVEYIEKRLLDLDTPSLEIIAAGQERLVVDAFARYQIINPLTFYQAVGNVAVGNQRLAVILNSAVRRVLGGTTLDAVVRARRAELMGLITQQVNQEAVQLGVRVVDVRIRRADLPEANSEAIFARMQTARQQEAALIRAQGEEQANIITAAADLSVRTTLANANRDSAILQGEAEAQANRILAQAFGLDASFFSFYRSMIAYREGLSSDTTTLLLSPDSEFFRFFADVNGGLDPAEILTPNTPIPRLENLPLLQLPAAEEEALDNPIIELPPLLEAPLLDFGVDDETPVDEPVPLEEPEPEEPAADEPAAG